MKTRRICKHFQNLGDWNPIVPELFCPGQPTFIPISGIPWRSGTRGHTGISSHVHHSELG